MNLHLSIIFLCFQLYYSFWSIWYTWLTGFDESDSRLHTINHIPLSLYHVNTNQVGRDAWHDFIDYVQKGVARFVNRINHDYHNWQEKVNPDNNPGYLHPELHNMSALAVTTISFISASALYPLPWIPRIFAMSKPLLWVNFFKVVKQKVVDDIRDILLIFKLIMFSSSLLSPQTGWTASSWWRQSIWSIWRCWSG